MHSSSIPGQPQAPSPQRVFSPSPGWSIQGWNGDTLGSVAVEPWVAPGWVPGETQGAVGCPREPVGCHQACPRLCHAGSATAWVAPELGHHGSLLSLQELLLLHLPLVAPGEDPGEDPGPAGVGGGSQPCWSTGISADSQNSREQRQLELSWELWLSREPWELLPQPLGASGSLALQPSPGELGNFQDPQL